MSRRRSLWVPHPAEVYVIAEADAETFASSADVLQVVTSDGQALKVKKQQCVEIADTASLTEQCDDLILLREVNEATILHTLRDRFKQDKIYTAIGTVLVSLNPFRPIEGLYDKGTARKYTKAMYSHTHDTLPPHVFVIAASAFNSMRINQMPQSILISGESGAGKTEATKQCLQFLSTSTGTDGATDTTRGTMTIEEKVIAASPILEAFGNAKTVRNDNSSRFGKWINILFRKTAPSMVQMVACQTTSYLLEKSRVTRQEADERNFHIFYQLLAHPDEAFRDRARLRSPESYWYLSQSGCITLPSQDDAANYREVLDSFGVLGFSPETVECIKAVTAAVLTLGNIKFDPINDGEGSKLSDSSCGELEVVCRLLEVPVEVLEQNLVEKTIQAGSTRRSFTKVLLRPTEATAGRDALARNVFQNLFEKILVEINRLSLGDAGTVDERLAIGILDIFGFEIFTTNSLEQLCINFANEALQKHFNNHIFTLETQLYADEGVKCEQIAFRDNTQVMSLIQSAFLALDEEGRIPKGTADTFFSKFKRAHSDAKHKQLVEFPALRPTFKVAHYAGSVEYDPAQFMAKNKDTYSANLVATLQASSNAYISELFAQPSSSPSSPSARQSKAKETVTSLFRAQMGALVTNLEQTKSHFIRCVKSNAAKKPREMDALLVYDQLRCSGVLEIVQIQQSGLPFRYKHEVFVKRCSPIVRWRFREHGYDTAQLVADVQHVVSDLCQFYPELRFQIGRTMVFYTASENRMLETALQHIQRLASISMQRHIRGLICRTLRQRVVTVRKRGAAAVKERDAAVLEAVLDELQQLQERYRRLTGSLVLQEDVTSGQTTLRKFVLQDACAKRLAAVLQLDLFEHVMELEELVVEADALDFDIPLVQQAKQQLATVREVLGALTMLEGDMSRVSIEQLARASATVAASTDRIRSAFPNRDVNNLLTRAETRLEKLRVEVSQHFPKMAEALRTGAATYTASGECLIESLRTQALEGVRSEVDGLSFESEDCTAARQMVNSIVGLRRALAQHSMQDAQQALSACQSIALPAVQALVQDELSSAHAYIASERSARALMDAFSAAMLPSEIPLQYTESRLQPLKAAIDSASSSAVPLLPFAASRLECVKLAYQVRHGLASGQIRLAIDALEALRTLRQSGSLLPALAEECNIAQQHVIFFQVRDGLDEIVQAGPPMLQKFDILEEDDGTGSAELLARLDDMARRLEILKLEASGSAVVAPLVSRVQLLLSLRYSVIQQDASQIEAKLEKIRSAHVGWVEAAAELQMARRMFELLRLRGQLLEGLAQGRIKWAMRSPDVDVNAVSDATIRSALEAASACEHASAPLERLVKICNLIRQARRLVLEGYSAEELDHVVRSLDSASPLPPACVDELAVLRELTARATATEAMNKLLQAVVASGTTGHVKLRATNEEELLASLAAAKQAFARAQPIPALAKLCEDCEYMTAVRCAVVANDRAKVRELLIKERREPAAPAAAGELVLLQAEMQHEDTISALLAGCAPLQFTSRIGEMQGAELETQRLETALSLAENHGTYNNRSVGLKHICQLLLQVRRTAANRTFDSISDQTLDELKHKMEQQRLDISEVSRYQYELDNHAATAKLKTTLLSVEDRSQSTHNLDERFTDALEWCDRLTMRSEQCNCLIRVTRCYLQLLRATSQNRYRETVKQADAVAQELASLQQCLQAVALGAEAQESQENAHLVRAVEAAASEQRRVAEGHLLAAELRGLIARSQIRGRPFHLLYDAGSIAALDVFLSDQRRGTVLQQHSEYHRLLAAAAASLHIRQEIAADRRKWFNTVTEEDLAQANQIPTNHDENRLLRSDFALQQACSNIEACLADNAFAQTTNGATSTIRQQVLTELGAAVNVVLKSSDALPDHVRALAAVGNELISIGYEWTPELASHSLPVVMELNASLRRRIAEVERHCSLLAVEMQQCVCRITRACLSHYDDALAYARVADLLQQILAALADPTPATRQQRAAALGKILNEGLSKTDGGNSQQTIALLGAARKFGEAARLACFGEFSAAARSIQAVDGFLEQIPQRTRDMVQHFQGGFAQFLQEPDKQPEAVPTKQHGHAGAERQVVPRAYYRDPAQILPTTAELCTVDTATAIVRRSLLVAFSDYPDLEVVVATQRRADVLCDLLSALGTLAASITDNVPLTDVLASPDEFLYVDYWRIESVLRRVPIDDPAFTTGQDELATVLVDIANRLLNLVTSSRPCLGLGESAALLDLLDVPFSDLLVDEHPLLQEAASSWVAAATQVKSLVYQVRFGAQILENFQTTDEDLQSVNKALEAAAAELAAITAPASCARVLHGAELMLSLRNEARSPSTDELFHEYMVEWASLPQLLRTCGEAHLEMVAKEHSKACHRRHVQELLERLDAPTLELEDVESSAQTVYEEVLHTPSVAMYSDELHMWEAVLSLISLLECRTAVFMEDKVIALKSKYQDRISGVFFEQVLFACKKQQILQHCWDYVHAKEEFPGNLLDAAYKGRDQQVDYVLDAIPVLQAFWNAEQGDPFDGDEKKVAEVCSRDVRGLHYLRDAVERAYLLASREKLVRVVHEAESQLTGEFARELFATPANPTPSQQQQLEALAARLEDCQHVPMGITLQYWVQTTMQAVTLLINGGAADAVKGIAQTIVTLPGSEALRDFGAQLGAFLEWRCEAEEIIELLSHGVKIVDSVVVAPPAARMLRLFHIASHIRGHAQAGQLLDLADLLLAVHDLRLTATCDAELGDKLPVMISRAKAALTRATTKGLKQYIPAGVEAALKAEIGALADYIPSYMSTKELQRVLTAKTGDCGPLEAAIAFTEQFDNLNEQTQVLLLRSRLVLKLRKAQASDAWLIDSSRPENAHVCVEQIVDDWFACNFNSGYGAAEFYDARNLCAEHRLEALLEELEASVQDDDQLRSCLERTLHFAIQHRAQLSTDAYEEVDACMAVYNVLTAYSGQRWGVFWQHSRSLRIFSTGLPVRLQFLTPVLERVQKTYHEALLCDYLLSVLLNVERPVAKKWFEENRTLLSTLENCIAWVHLEPFIRLLMTGSMSDVVAEWTRSSAHLKLVLDSADENDLLVAALVARLCLLKRTYLSEVVTSVNAKIFTEAETIEDALNHYPLVHSMLESVKEYQLDQVDLELRNIDECWNLLFHFSDCTGDAEKTACLATIPNAIQAQRVRHLLYEKFQSQTALDMTIQINEELHSLGPILRTQSSMIDCMQEIAWHYATLDGLLKKSKTIMLQSGSSVFEDLQVARDRAKQVRALRKAVLQRSWERVVELVAEMRQSSHGAFLAEEVTAMEMLYLHLTHLNKLQEQLAMGPCSGELGQMDDAVDDINLDGLQQVLSEYALSKQFAISHEIEQLRESAMFVLRLREAVIEGRWGEAEPEPDADGDDNNISMANNEDENDEEAETVAAMLKRPIALQPVSAVAAEIQRVRDELLNKRATRLLEEALSRGASYVDDINDFRLVECDVLQHAISRAVALNRKSVRVQLLLPAAQKVRQLRLVVMNGEWSKLRSFLEELKDADIPPEIVTEVKALREIDHINFALQEKIWSAFQRGRVRGTPTQLDTRDVSVTDLNAALVFAAQRNIHSKADQSLIRTAELLRDLRLCVLSADFKSASDRLKGGTVSSLHPAAKEELLLIKAAVETIDVLEELTQALLLDAPTGRAGSFSTATIRTRRIENVLASTSTSGLESMNQLAPSIRAIRDLRNAVCSGKWDERVVASNPVLRKSAPSTFRTIQLVQPEVPEASSAAQNISQQLYKKLASSTLASTFQSAVAPRPVHASEVPVAVPRTNESFNPDSRDTHNSSIAVTRALQMLGLGQDSVAFALSRLPAKMSSYTEQEVRLVRNELYHRVVCHALQAAIAPLCTTDSSAIAGDKVAAAGVEEDEETILDLLQELEGAMCVAHHLGLPSPQSRRLYNTAFVMHSVRQAELSSEWDATSSIASLVKAGKNQQLFEEFVYQEVQLACARHQFRVITLELERQLSVGDVVFETRSEMQKLRQAWQRGMPGANIDDDSLVMLDVTNTLHDLRLANKSRNFDAIRKCCDELADVLDRLPSKFQQFRHLLELEVSHQRRLLLEQKLPFLNFGAWLHLEVTGLTRLQGVLSRLIDTALAPFFRNMADKPPVGVAFETVMVRVSLRRHALLRQFLDQSNKVLASISAEGRNHPELRRQFLQTAYSAVFVLATSLLCVRELLKPDPSESGLPRLRSRSNSHSTRGSIAATSPPPRNSMFMLGLQATVSCIPQVVCSSAADALKSLAAESTRRDSFSSSTILGEYLHQVTSFAVMAGFVVQLQEMLQLLDPDSGFIVTQQTLALLPRQIKAQA